MKILKITLLVYLITFMAFGQIQIGADINGVAVRDLFGNSVSLSSDGTVLAVGAANASESGAIGDERFSGYVGVYKNISGTWTQIGANIDGEFAGDGFGKSVSLSSDGSIIAVGAKFRDVRVFKNMSGTWTQIGENIDSGAVVSLSSDGSIVAIGSTSGRDIDGIKTGNVSVYENISGTWTQIGITIDGEANQDQSGHSVSLSADGSVVAIGARLNAGNGVNSGHVRIYENVAGTWTQIGVDIDGEESHDKLGTSVSLSSDGAVLAIGAIDNSENGSSSGQVRVYNNVAGTWTQIGVDIDGESEGDLFGFSVSLSSDGSILAVGAVRDDDNGSSSGQVRVYNNVAGTWTKLGSDINGESEGDESGRSVSLSSDGSVVAIGASSNDGNGSNSGHVRVYDLSVLLSSNEFVSSQFKLYPNPAKTQFTIQMDPSFQLEKVSIYNLLGQVALTSKKHLINTSKLSSGSYFVEITTNQGKVTKKLIIK